ncbi:MAG TPA: CPBP family glutamic-type intramembrane protease [Oceanobacillus sp.]|nr:CPBP family glutamic-type intramembrane protease [Oceanobacillus sp.]
MAERKSLFAKIGTLDPAPPWGLGAVVLAVVVAFAAIIVGSTVALVLFENQPFMLLAGWTLGGIVTIASVLQMRRRPEDRAALKLDKSGASLLFIMFLSIGFALLFDLIGLAVTGEFLPKPELSGANLQAGGLATWAFAVAFMLAAQPIAEELVFRGVAFPVLRSMLGAWVGLVAAAALYALFHLLAYPPGYVTTAGITPIWYGLALPFLDGVIISAVRAHTGSTRAAIAAHVAFGLFALVKALAV